MNNILEKYLAKIAPATDVSPGPQIGIDLGNSHCRGVEVQRRGNGYEVNNVAVAPVKEGDKKTALTAVLSKLPAQTHSLASAVFGKGTLIRYIDMPSMKIDELKKSFAFEAEKYFPFPSDQIFFDCAILQQDEKAHHMTVLAAAAKKDLVQQRMDLFSSLGLQADCIGLNAIAIANVVHEVGAPRSVQSVQLEDGVPSAFAIVDIGELESNLMIFVGTLPFFTRDIYIGGKDVTESIKNNLDVSLEEASALKISQEDPKKISEACEATVMNLISDIRLSFDYFVTEKNVTLSKIFLTGGSSRLPGLLDALHRYLELPVELWDPMEHFTVAASCPQEELKTHAGSLGVALGLAIYNR